MPEAPTGLKRARGAYVPFRGSAWVDDLRHVLSSSGCAGRRTGFPGAGGRRSVPVQALGSVEKEIRKTECLAGRPLLDVVAALQKAGKISESDVAVWKAMVYLRNVFSHPSTQDNRKRDEAVDQLAFIATLLNRLFK